MAHWTKKLPRDTCVEALAWAISYASAEAAWTACTRGDWMVDILQKRAHTLTARQKTELKVLHAYVTGRLEQALYWDLDDANAACADAVRAKFPSPPRL